ncbi:MAG: flagellar protein [Lachnospiraceae bacterium]|mgnify:CR=1 FL=1|jgi:flagellar operon protein (TIGR03826 family)|nr:flagellar protein [Lachnospiraceae bacterium]
MNVRNCRNCGCIFNYVTGPVICPACREKLEEKFQEVKEYIRDNKGAGIPEVAEACDVEVAQIRQWLREGRLELTEDAQMYLSCETCGKPIRSGRFCEKCTLNMSRGFQEVLNAGKDTSPRQAKNDGEGPKMRYLK